MPRQRLPQHLPGEVEVRLHHLGARQGTLATGCQAVGDAQQRDVGGHRLGRRQVLVDGAPRQRSLVDQEAQAKVMPRKPLQRLAQPAARPKPRADVPRDPGSDLVVTDEGHIAASLGAGLGLADIVEQLPRSEGRHAA